MTEQLATLSLRASRRTSPWRHSSTRRSLRHHSRRLGLESLEDRTLLSVTLGTAVIGADYAYPLTSTVQATSAAATQALFGATFTTRVPIIESATPQWGGYDIDARSLPANATIDKIVLHHSVAHPRVSDLQVRLTAEDGTNWLIRKNSGGWVKNFDEYRTDTTVFAGRSAAQMFHYQIADTVVNNLKGTLRGLQIWITYTVPPTSPDLTVTASHEGNLSQGQTGAVYTLNVKNVGNGSTVGTVSLKDVLPAGVTATSFSGSGWTTNLTTMTATRNDVLAPGASYAPLSVTVNVAPDAPLSIINTAQVSGGGDSNTANNTVTDAAAVTAMPNLAVTLAHSGDFVPGQSGTYTMLVKNLGGGASSGLVSLREVLPQGFAATSLAGDGWTTNLSTLTATRSDSLAPGASFAPLTLIVGIPNNASGSVTSTAQVSGGGQIYTTDDTASDVATIVSATPILVDKSFSVTNARDGQVITVNYQISSSVNTSLLLGCSIVGSDGIVINDTANAKLVAVRPGTNWYSRSFSVNLPPAAVTGAYSATWTISGDGIPASSVTQTAAITVDPAIAVRVPVLMYHNIETTSRDFYTVSTDNFRAQMRALKAYGYTTVSYQDVLDYRAGVKTPPAKPILLTFDDAYESLLTIVLPIISDPSIDFRITSFVNTADVRPEDVEGGYPTDPLSWSQLRTLDASGRVDIQSHTVSHYDLTTLDASALTAELVNSKTTIEQQLNLNKQPGEALKRVDFLAYPYGAYNSSVEQAVWQAGYKAAAAVEDQIELSAADKLALDRVQMDWNTSVQLEQSGWWAFFANRLEDSDVAVPMISVSGIQYSASSVRRGETATITVNVNNSGSTAPVLASLTIDSDSNHANGVIYNSHTTSPTGDIQATVPWGTSSLTWNWTVPNDAPTGQYYVTVSFNDIKYVYVFRTAPWTAAFQVNSLAPAMAAALATESLTTADAERATTITPVASAAAYDAVLAKAATTTGSPVASSSASSRLLQALARNLQSKQFGGNGSLAASLAAVSDAVFGDLLSLSLDQII